jgi:hypothetical protein
MEQSPSWESNSQSGSQILRLLWNPKVYSRVHKSPLLDLILSHMSPVCMLTAYFILLTSNLSLSYTSTPPVVTGDKNSPPVVHACRKRLLKWVLGAWGYNWATQSPGDINMKTWSSRLGVGAQG